jgi:hypothetical protein
MAGERSTRQERRRLALRWSLLLPVVALGISEFGAVRVTGDVAWANVSILLLVAYGVVALILRAPASRTDDYVRILLLVYLVGIYGVGLYFTGQAKFNAHAGTVEDLINWRKVGTEIGFLTLTPIAALGAISVSGVWRYWFPWRPPERLDAPKRVRLLPPLLGMVALTEGFIFYAAIATDSVGQAATYFLWHLAEAVPVLRIPATLNWNPRFAFDSSAAGVALLAYKILIILPTIAIARDALAPDRRARK